MSIFVKENVSSNRQGSTPLSGWGKKGLNGASVPGLLDHEHDRRRVRLSLRAFDIIGWKVLSGWQQHVPVFLYYGWNSNCVSEIHVKGRDFDHITTIPATSFAFVMWPPPYGLLFYHFWHKWKWPTYLMRKVANSIYFEQKARVLHEQSSDTFNRSTHLLFRSSAFHWLP